MTSSLDMTLIAPEIKVNGTEMSASLLNCVTGLTVRSGLRIPARAILRFADVGFAVAAGGQFAPGTVVEVSVAGGATLFSGEVTGIDLQLDRGIPDFTVIADDRAYKLTLGNSAKSYLQMSFSDIVSKIAGAAGLTANVDSTSTVFDYVMQADTDFGFLNELADRVGFDWWVSGQELNFKKVDDSAASALTLTMGENLRQFSVKASALHPGSTTVTGWDTKSKNAYVGNSASATGLPTADLVSGFLSAPSLSSQNNVISSMDGPLSDSEATALASRISARASEGATTARGTCLASDKLVPGSNVTVVNAGPASGKYFVTEVEHTYTSRGFESRFTAGERRPAGLVDTLSSSGPSSFRIPGLVVGVVTAVGNSQGSPGDVKVSYPSIDSSLQSGWARMLSVGGGAQRGMTFMPEVNDEVIVGFEGGDPRRPVVLGGLFNGKDAQPTFNFSSGKVQTRQITSRLGHVLEFGDGDSDPQSYIAMTLAGAASSVKLSKEKLDAVVPQGIPVNITAGNSSIKIGNDGSITISGQKITLKSETDVEISGLNIDAKASVKFSAAGAMVQLKADAQAEVSASGPVMIKGMPVMVN